MDKEPTNDMNLSLVKRLLSETSCPKIIVILIQLHSNYINENNHTHICIVNTYGCCFMFQRNFHLMTSQNSMTIGTGSMGLSSKFAWGQNGCATCMTQVISKPYTDRRENIPGGYPCRSLRHIIKGEVFHQD